MKSFKYSYERKFLTKENSHIIQNELFNPKRLISVVGKTSSEQKSIIYR